MLFGVTEVEFLESDDIKFVKTTAYTVDPVLGKMVEETTTYAPTLGAQVTDIVNYTITEDE